MHLAVLYFEGAFDSPHRGRRLKALHADGIPGMLVSLLDNMNQRTSAIVRLLAGCETLGSAGYGITKNGLNLCKRWQKIEEVGGKQSYVQGRHTSAEMRVISSGDDISPPIKLLITTWPELASKSKEEFCEWLADHELLM
ncbi:hypothetical protein RB195_018586 [Necator americanus]|uniref:Uncharacterized protein n=1 Tax=Necator americanus TaxID=51031 RepID=A0ABR1CCL6_NECAM